MSSAPSPPAKQCQPRGSQSGTSDGCPRRAHSPGRGCKSQAWGREARGGSGRAGHVQGAHRLRCLHALQSLKEEGLDSRPAHGVLQDLLCGRGQKVTVGITARDASTQTSRTTGSLLQP